jgi:hypothetical protein
MCPDRTLLVENFDEIMYGFEIGEIVIVDIDTNAEVEAGITSIDNFEITKLECEET